LFFSPVSLFGVLRGFGFDLHVLVPPKRSAPFPLNSLPLRGGIATPRPTRFFCVRLSRSRPLFFSRRCLRLLSLFFRQKLGWLGFLLLCFVPFCLRSFLSFSYFSLTRVCPPLFDASPAFAGPPHFCAPILSSLLPSLTA